MPKLPSDPSERSLNPVDWGDSRSAQRQERLQQTVTKSRRARGQAQVVPVASGTTTTMSSGLASSTTLDRAALTVEGPVVDTWNLQMDRHNCTVPR